MMTYFCCTKWVLKVVHGVNGGCNESHIAINEWVILGWWYLNTSLLKTLIISHDLYQQWLIFQFFSTVPLQFGADWSTYSSTTVSDSNGNVLKDVQGTRLGILCVCVVAPNTDSHSNFITENCTVRSNCTLHRCLPGATGSERPPTK